MIVKNHHKDNIGIYIFFLVVILFVLWAFLS